MDDGRHENGRHKQDYYRGAPSPWNMSAQQHMKEPNALVMNKKIMSIIAERDTAIRERNAAISEKNEALAARDEALRQRDEAFAQRDTAQMERDNAFAAFHIRDNSMNFPLGGRVQRGSKRTHYPSNHPVNMTDGLYSTKDAPITEAFPISVLSSEAIKSRQTKRSKENKASKASRTSRKKVGEDLNRQASTDGIKYRSEWDTQDLGLNLVSFDETTMPVPVCSCTGMPRQCYKWGNGGWQSSCCTTNMSMYPLPQMPNKRHARMGGRKMSGSVFTRLLSRLAAEGHDLSVPLDLKEYWARHGTNRYITIKYKFDKCEKIADELRSLQIEGEFFFVLLQDLLATIISQESETSLQLVFGVATLMTIDKKEAEETRTKYEQVVEDLAAEVISISSLVVEVGTISSSM